MELKIETAFDIHDDICHDLVEDSCNLTKEQLKDLNRRSGGKWVSVESMIERLYRVTDIPLRDAVNMLELISELKRSITNTSLKKKKLGVRKR